MAYPTTLAALIRFAFAAMLIAFACATSPTLRADTTLIPAGATWKYLDNGSDQGTAWRGTSFSDSAWASGPAELGYGDAAEARPEATVVSYGPNASAKYVTTYFRHAFNVADASAFATLKLRVVRDDGVVVYLNGQEIWRNSMPTTFNYQTVATAAISGADEYTFLETIVPSTALLTGQNVLAAEIHQSGGTSTDISFNLELIGRPAGLVRQPYLQIGTPTSVVVRWRTDIATDSVVRFGGSPAELISSVTADQGSPKTEHEVTLTGLTPDTRYYYSVGSSSATFSSGESHVFFTAPPVGSAHPTRVWVIGDAGTGTANQLAVRDSYYSLAQGAYTDVMLMLGDNVYETGTDDEYTSRHFGVYQDMLRQTVSWPTIGNHDTAGSTSPSGTIPYYQSFSLPTAGQAGGVPSGTEDYYSFDYGDIHFVCLDSMTENRAVNGPMATWLVQDLAATTQKWIIAYWHHPPYSKGHDSDTDTMETQMRSNIVPILEDYGVDLVLSGHSHAYERSYLLDGHYGTSSTLNASMIKDGSDGRGVGGYNKPGAGGTGHEGAVYAVAGSSGKAENYAGISDTGSGNGTGHPAMFISWERLGAMIIDVDGYRMDVKFLRETGVIADTFTITRGPRTNIAPSVSITSPANAAEFNRGQAITINATASDGDQGISEVVYYANASRIATLPGNGSGSAYSFAWTPPVNGNYRLEVRAVDQLGSSTVSAPIDVVVSTGVPVPDTTPPAAIANLAAAAGLNDVALSWRSPGDDGADTGAAASYDIRYSTIDPATDSTSDKSAWWAAALQASDEPLPAAAGTTQTLAITGLQSETTYYFAVKATDDAANVSPLSNIAIATTLTQPPASPSGLIAANAPGGGVNLTWTDNSTDEDGFSIERSLTNTTGFAQIQWVGANAVSFSDTLVYPGTAYFYRVIATKGSTSSAHSNIASVTTPPAAPMNLSASATSSSVTLTWSASTGAQSYTIARLNPASGNFETVSSGVTALSFTDGGLAAGTNYAYRVSGVNAGGVGAYSETAIQTLQPNPPTAPAGLAATASGTTTIQLSWTDTASNETGFAIERSTDGVAFLEIATANANAAGHGDAGLTQGTAYWYRVRAFNADGYSSFSNIVSATTLAPQPPVAPSNLSATPISGTQINVAWSDNASSEDGFYLERSENGGAYARIATVAANVTSHSDIGLPSGTTYSYRVQAFNGAGASAYSAPATATTLSLPNAPANLVATAVSKSQINLTWNDTSANETGFVVERSTNNRTFSVIASLGANATGYSDAGLAPAKLYYYRVFSQNSLGQSAASNIATATTLKK
jgi:hypothetical protein